MLLVPKRTAPSWLMCRMRRLLPISRVPSIFFKTLGAGASLQETAKRATMVAIRVSMAFMVVLGCWGWFVVFEEQIGILSEFVDLGLRPRFNSVLSYISYVYLSVLYYSLFYIFVKCF